MCTPGARAWGCEHAAPGSHQLLCRGNNMMLTGQVPAVVQGRGAAGLLVGRAHARDVGRKGRRVVQDVLVLQLRGMQQGQRMSGPALTWQWSARRKQEESPHLVVALHGHERCPQHAGRAQLSHHPNACISQARVRMARRAHAGWRCCPRPASGGPTSPTAHSVTGGQSWQG